MRLLNVDSLEFSEFRDDQCPKYVIASHRWLAGAEVTLQDVRSRQNTSKSGYKKILEFAKYVKEHVGGIEWLWVDTCCINKDSAAELSKSLNLMFNWYRNAVLCIAYLVDVKEADNIAAFEQSEWFQRGWTLQELLAPRLIIFVTESWKVIGNKGASGYVDTGTTSGHGLENTIATITDIPERVLHDYAASSSFSMDEKLKWMDGRVTTEPEDMSYALYGILGVRPGANYGEGYDGARQRLLDAVNHQKKIATQQAEQFQKIAAWLSPSDPWTNHHLARKLHEPETGSWLLTSNQYKGWKSGALRHLWVSGMPGCGKTVLCSNCIEDIKAHCRHRPELGYAIFYFSFSDERKQRLEDLLCSLVVQLGWKGTALSMLQQAYDRPGRNSTLGTGELENILLASFREYENVYILLDAIDESPGHLDVRYSVLNFLTKLQQHTQHVKLFATSREVQEIRTTMIELDAMPIALSVTAIDGDIRRYVATQLSRDHRLSRLDPKTKELIEETLSKANGMFQWAHFQLQELKKLKVTRPSNIKSALTTLPKDLDETYERVLARIDPNAQADALKLLTWLAYATRPLSLAELVEAVIIEHTGDGRVDFDDRPKFHDILEILPDFIVTEAGWSQAQHLYGQSKSGDHYGSITRHVRVRLAHFSIQEYLESDRLRLNKVKDFHLEYSLGHRILTQSCLCYMTHYSRKNDKSSNSQDLIDFPLLEYAARSWFIHSSLHQSEDVSYEVFFLTTRGILEDWLLIFDPERDVPRYFDPPAHVGPGLYYASILGLGTVAKALLTRGADPNAVGGGCGNALQAATSQGHERVVQILINAGADVNALAMSRFYALWTAIQKNHNGVARILIDSGASVQNRGERSTGPLQIAAWCGNGEAVQMLIDAGADINAPGGRQGGPLIAASFRGQENVVKRLLAAGADVNARGGQFGSALQAASYKGDKDIVQRLLDAGADIDFQEGQYGSALHAAINRVHEDVVWVLVHAGANVTMEVANHGSALEAARASLSRACDVVYKQAEMPFGKRPGLDGDERPFHRGLLPNVHIVEMLEAAAAAQLSRQ